MKNFVFCFLIKSLLLASADDLEAKLLRFTLPLHKFPGALEYWKNKTNNNLITASERLGNFSNPTETTKKMQKMLCAPGILNEENAYWWFLGPELSGLPLSWFETCKADIRKFFEQQSYTDRTKSWVEYRRLENSSDKISAQLTNLGIRNLGLDFNVSFICEIHEGKILGSSPTDCTIDMTQQDTFLKSIKWKKEARAKIGNTENVTHLEPKDRVGTHSVFSINSTSSDALGTFCFIMPLLLRNRTLTSDVLTWKSVQFLWKLSEHPTEKPSPPRSVRVNKIEYFGEYRADVTIKWDCPEQWHSLPLEYEVSCINIRHDSTELNYFVPSDFFEPETKFLFPGLVNTPKWWTRCTINCYKFLNLTECNECWERFHSDKLIGRLTGSSRSFRKLIDWHINTATINVGSSTHLEAAYALQNTVIQHKLPGKKFADMKLLGATLKSILVCKVRGLTLKQQGDWSDPKISYITFKGAPDLFVEESLPSVTISDIFNNLKTGTSFWQLFHVSSMLKTMVANPTSRSNILRSATNLTAQILPEIDWRSFEKPFSTFDLNSIKLTLGVFPDWFQFFNPTKLSHVDLESSELKSIPTAYTIRPNIGLGVQGLNIHQPKMFYYQSKLNCFDWMTQTWYNVIDLFGKPVIIALSEATDERKEKTKLFFPKSEKVFNVLCLVRASIILWIGKTSNINHNESFEIESYKTLGNHSMNLSCIPRACIQGAVLPITTSVSFPRADIVLTLHVERLQAFSPNSCQCVTLLDRTLVKHLNLSKASQLTCNMDYCAALLSDGTILRYNAKWVWKEDSALIEFLNSLSLKLVQVGSLNSANLRRTPIPWEHQQNYYNYPSHQHIKVNFSKVSKIWLPNSPFLASQIPAHCLILTVNEPSATMVDTSTALISLVAQWNNSNDCIGFSKPYLVFRVGFKEYNAKLFKSFQHVYKNGLPTENISSLDIIRQWRNDSIKSNNSQIHRMSESAIRLFSDGKILRNHRVGQSECFTSVIIEDYGLWQEATSAKFSNDDKYCTTRSTRPSPNLTQLIALENLKPDIHYYVEAYAMPLLSQELISLMDKAYAAVNPSHGRTAWQKQMPTLNTNFTLFRSKFIPKPQNRAALISVAVGSSLVILALVAMVSYFAYEYWYKFRDLTRISAKQLVFPNNFNPTGEGRFSEIRKATYFPKNSNEDGIPVAVKSLKLNSTDREKRQLIDESLILGLLCRNKAPNVVQIIGLCYEDKTRNHPKVILEFLEGGSLLEFLHSHANHPCLKESQLWKICKSVCKACIFLQDKGIIHRDIAARNVLLGSKDPRNLGQVKLADFGLAKIEKDVYQNPNPDHILPIPWMSPEALLLSRYTTQSDVWSFGILMWEVMSWGAKPYGRCSLDHLCLLGAMTNDEIHHAVTGGKTLLDLPDPCSAVFSEDMKKLLLKVWSYAEKDRPHFKNLADKINKLQLFSTWKETFRVVMGNDFIRQCNEMKNEMIRQNSEAMK